MTDKSDKTKDRHEAALEQIHIIGQYLIMMEDCPANVRDAWRTLKNYIANNKH